MTLTDLKTAAELSEMIGSRVSVERLLFLAERGSLPSYQLEGVTYFDFDETVAAISKRLLIQRGSLPSDEFRIAFVYPTNSPPLPEEISPLSAFLMPLAVASTEIPQWAGIYFLCLNAEVVYVGQANNLASRVPHHCKSKPFDSVFCVRVPTADLDHVESRWIDILRPRYNYSRKKQRFVRPPDCDTPTDFGAFLVNLIADAKQRERSPSLADGTGCIGRRNRSLALSSCKRA